MAYPCASCKHSDPDYAPLPIHPTSLKSPFRTHQPDSTPKEPAMARCRHCHTDVSSQHLIRQALIHDRPPTWPPPAIAQTTIPMAETDVVMKHTHKLAHPTTLPSHTTDPFAPLHEYDMALLATKASLVKNNKQQNHHTKHVQDIEYTDPLFQYIFQMPLRPQDARLPLPSRQFALLLLIAMVQTHWWTHSPSCFKTSRTTPTPNL
jgi:hypothetical protein